MRTRFRYDKDLDAVIEIREQSNFYEEEKPQTANVITDDMGAGVNGLRAMYRSDKKHFDSKSAYRADVKARGLAEVGNDSMASPRPVVPLHYYGERAKQAFEQFESNHNGTADQVRAMQAQTEWRKRNG